MGTQDVLGGCMDGQTDRWTGRQMKGRREGGRENVGVSGTKVHAQ